MCLYPRLIKNRKYIKNKKNGGNIPPLPLIKIGNKLVEDKRVLEVPIGCGKCMECKKQKARDWQVRLLEEVKSDKRGTFITLTFSDKSIKELDHAITKKNGKELQGYNRDNAIATLGVRRFLERWRKEFGKSVKHWLVTELGGNGTENIHLHGFIWTNEPCETIRRKWDYGYIWSSKEKGGWVNGQTVNYVVKYIHKTDIKHTEYKSKVLTSSGIGKGYLDHYALEYNKFDEENTKEYYKTKEGIKLALPIYYRNHIYNEKEKEMLWRIKLDKNERYVLGQKIEPSEDDKYYYKALENARKLNNSLGYGNDKIDWNLKNYENERRNIKTLERIKRAEQVRTGQKSRTTR